MTDVPSNLIPTRVTQLPEYTGDSTEGYSIYALEGRTYKAKLANIVAPLADDVAIAAAAAEAAKDAAQTYKFQTEALIQDGADSALLAQAWAEGTMPGGAATKSAKEWSEESALSAAAAEAVAGPTYASTAAGLAATTSGQAFAVDAGGGLVSVYLNSSGTAVLLRTIVTAGALAASDGASLIGAYDPVAPAYLKTVSDIISGLPVNLFRFIPASKHDGIRNRSNADDLSTNFADALASGAKEINVEPGLYNTTTAIAMATADQALKGAGSRRSEIRITSTTAPAVTFAGGIAGYGLSGFKITRVGSPGAAAHGVQCLGTTDDSTLEDLWIDGHYHNLILNTCDTGFIHKMRLSRALGYGCLQTNAASYGPSQWDVFNILFDRNASDGWRIESTAGPAGMILGAMANVRGFANGGRDLHVIGSNTTPVYDVRVSDAFFGSSNSGCVRLDTYGGKHRLNGFFERAGRDACGPTLGIPASQAATCIEMTANNVDLVVYGSTIDEASYDGIQHDGGLLNVSGCMIYNNGAAGTAGRRNGILSQGGRLTVGSDTIVNVPSKSGGALPASQLYAIATSHSNVTIGSSDLLDNSTGSITLGATTNAVVAGNATDSGTLYRFPNTIDVLKFNSAYTPTATGGDKGAGTINVATDVYKNNTAYTNP